MPLILGSAASTLACGETACPVPEWAPWLDWTSCSQDCDSGVKSRSRECLLEGSVVSVSTCTDAGLTGSVEGDVACNTDPCFSKTILLKSKPRRLHSLALALQEWGEWSECDRPCGTGAQSRTRTCRDNLSALETALDNCGEGTEGTEEVFCNEHVRNTGARLQEEGGN